MRFDWAHADTAMAPRNRQVVSTFMAGSRQSSFRPGARLDPGPDLAEVNRPEAQRNRGRLGPERKVALLRVREERVGVLRVPVLAPLLPLGPVGPGPLDLIALLGGIEVEVPVKLEGVGQGLRAGLV